MTESLSGARTPERGGSAVVEQLPVAKTYSTTAARFQPGVLLGVEEGGRDGGGPRWGNEVAVRVQG